MPERCIVLLGSNVRPETSLPAAAAELALAARVVGVSSVWRSPAVGAPGTPDFLNAAIALETDLSPYELREQVLRPIEAKLGRTRGADRNAPRTIDLDLVLFGERAGLDPRSGIVFPDPDLARLAHLAVPVAELEPERVLPRAGATLREIAAKSSSSGEIVRIDAVDLRSATLRVPPRGRGRGA
jgi:2-amino-4-hydroxy-6-hydroxymethyldihydropteridine diphosphokinase